MELLTSLVNIVPVSLFFKMTFTYLLSHILIVVTAPSSGRQF